MSNTFHINRLFALIARQWISFGKVYLMAIGIAAGVIAAFYGYALYEFSGTLSLWNTVPDRLLDFRVLLFIFLGLFFVTIIAGTYFTDYGQRPKAIFEVMIPASRLEKFLTALFYTVVVCLASYTAVFLCIDLGFVAYMSSMASGKLDHSQIAGGGLTFLVNYKMPKQAMYFLFLPFLFNAIFLLGSIAYHNFQYIKTAISLIIYIVIWSIGTFYIMKTLTEGSISIQHSSFWDDERRIFQVILSTGLVVTCLFWVIAFLRLKEKEV